jgi:ligand-binding SRPBCC domain-containing protein
VTRSVDVHAPAEAVWAIVSDLPGMGTLSPESTGGRWADGSRWADGTAGPAVGAVFRGTNASGSRTWSTRSTVVDSEPGRRFAFDVSSVGLPIARWSYDLVSTADGCQVTETWQDRRGRLVALGGRLLTGVQDRTAFTATSIEQTLARLKDRAESAA